MENINGKLIVLESCDSGGKSTQVKIIKNYYESLGKTIKHLHFPMYGHNQFSDMIARFLKGEFGSNDEVDPLFVANIYAMDRYCYKDQLIKDIKDFDIVLLDRYVLSNLAYQCSKVKSDEERNKLFDWILEFEFGFLDLPFPDLTIYFDLPIGTIKERLNTERIGDDRNYLDGEQDIHESDILFQERVKNIYLMMENVSNYFIIKAYNEDGILSPNDLFNTYKNLLK